MNSPLFIFKLCPLAAAHDARILQDFNFNLDKIIRSQHPSQLSYGSEFGSSKSLEGLMIDHPFWDHFKEILDNGALFPLQPISDESRQLDLYQLVSYNICQILQ
jgi:hypothetical protein